MGQNEKKSMDNEKTYFIDNPTHLKEFANILREYNSAEFFRDIGMFIDEEIVTDKDTREHEWKKLYQVYKEGKIIEGQISAIEPNLPGLNIRIIVSYGPFERIIIPDNQFFYPEFYSKSYAKLKDEEKFFKKLNLARTMLGAKISFIIMGMQNFTEETGKIKYIVIASRLKAGLMKREFFFFGEEENKIKKGDKVYARIIGINRLWIKVEAFGVECNMNISMLSYLKWISDCMKEFKLGQRIEVEVTYLKFEEDGERIRIRFYRAGLSKGPTLEKVQKLEPGMFLVGEIITYNHQKNLSTAILHGGILCSIPVDRVYGGYGLFPGDKVVVEIIEVNMKRGYVIGSATKKGIYI